ncbi:DUF3267 domain-containing protein [Haladaptatus sp. ZSTT2]|uniref:DUF3267 domain-containing protein n=1 Tax=Haladaptatus sp. ZSTT2 TaxID=3120515 RepID=UPI00300E8F10
MGSLETPPVATFAVSRQLALEWTGLSLAGFVVSLFALGGLYAGVTGKTVGGIVIESGNTGSVVTTLVVGLVLIIGVIVVHELIHGVAMSHYGGNPRYGTGVAYFVLPYAYATADTEFTRNQFIVIALAPLVIITAVGVPIMLIFDLPLLLLALAINIAGAVGDLWMVSVLSRFPADVDVVDTMTGLAVYGSVEAPPLQGIGGVLRRTLIGFGVTIGVFLIVSMLAPIFLSLAGVTEFSLGPPETIWSIFQWESSPEGFSSSLGGGIVGVSGLVGLAYGVLGTRRAR